MKIAVGAVAGTTGGPSTFAVELVRAMRELEGTHDVTVFTDCPEAFGAHIAGRSYPALLQTANGSSPVPIRFIRVHFDPPFFP